MHPYSSYDYSFSNIKNELNEDLMGKSNAERQEKIEKLAKKFETYLPLLKNSFVFKEPIIKFHPYSHFAGSQPAQVLFYD